MAEQISELFLTVSYNIIIFLICFMFFWVYRTFRARPGAAFYELDLSSWQSLLKVFTIDDSDLASHISLEGYIYLNFLKNCGFFFIASSIVTLLTLIPLYTNLNVSSRTSLSSLSIDQQESYDKELIIPGLCTLILTFGTFFLAYSYFLLSRIHPTLFPSVIYIKEIALSTLIIQSRTVFFEGLLQEIPNSLAERYLKEKLPKDLQNTIESIRTYPDFEILFELFNKRNELFYQLEEISLKESNQRSRCWNLLEKSGKIECIKALQVIETEIEKQVQGCNDRNLGYGFIYCADTESALKLVQLSNLGSLRFRHAPADSDLIWHHLTQHKALSLFKRFISNSLFILLFLVLFTPLTFSSLILQTLNDLSLPIPFLSQTLSSLTLSLFQYTLVPFLIRTLTNQELHSLKSEVSESKILKYLIYSLMNIIIFPLIGSVTLTVFLKKMLDVEIFHWNVNLARNIGTVGGFFVNFIVSMAFVSNILDLLAINSYVAGKVGQWKAATFGEAQQAALAPEFDFAHEYSKILTVFAVTLMFSVSSPLILPFGALYMFLKYFIDKYNLLFAYRISKDEALTVQKTVISSIFVISALFQTVNSGLFMISGISMLIWLGGTLSALSLCTLGLAVGLYRYWDLLQNVEYGYFYHLKVSFDKCYSHPCEPIIRDFQSRQH